MLREVRLSSEPAGKSESDSALGGRDLQVHSLGVIARDANDGRRHGARLRNMDANARGPNGRAKSFRKISAGPRGAPRAGLGRSDASATSPAGSVAGMANVSSGTAASLAPRD
jgi:hypothetical protein